MKLSTLFASVGLATVALIPASPSFAYDGSLGRLDVTVVSSADGLPVRGIPVTISAAGVVEDAVTDSGGIAHFASVRAGVVSVETQERALGNCAKTVSVKAQRTTDVTFQLDVEALDTPFTTSTNSKVSCNAETL